MRDKRYTPPKFKKGDTIRTDDNVVAKIEMLSYEMGETWYFVNNKWYAETELKGS